MRHTLHILTFAVLCFASCIMLQAQEYKTALLKSAAEKLGLQIMQDSIMPDSIHFFTAKDGRKICVRTNPMGQIEHIGIPLFNEGMRFLQPSPVYDFLEFALINKKYTVTPNQLYLSKVIFKKGNWDTLLNGNLEKQNCSIENMDDKLYIVRWLTEEKEKAVIGIPIEYELLNNDTRRNMEQLFIKELSENIEPVKRPSPSFISEDNLSIYGTEGLFVETGNSYLVSLLNNNIYYKLTTVVEKTDSIIRDSTVTLTLDAILPTVVRDKEYPAETLANLMICDNTWVPDATVNLDFHLSNYIRKNVTMPLSCLKAFCRQQGCQFYFACSGITEKNISGVFFASNLPKGYNHLFCIKTEKEQLDADNPVINADVYLYIPPIDKSKLFGTTPTKKSGIKFFTP